MDTATDNDLIDFMGKENKLRNALIISNNNARPSTKTKSINGLEDTSAIVGPIKDCRAYRK